MPSVATISRFGAMVLYRFGYFSTRLQSGPPMTMRAPYCFWSISAPPIWSAWAWEMRTYLMSRGFELEPLHAADDQLLRVVGKNRIEQDDALARRQRPGRVQFPADEVEVVEHLRRIRIPCVTCGRTGRFGDVPRDGIRGVLAAALRQQARSDQGALEIEPRRRLRRLHGGPDLRVEISASRPLLREHAGGAECGHKGKRCGVTLPWLQHPHLFPIR